MVRTPSFGGSSHSVDRMKLASCDYITPVGYRQPVLPATRCHFQQVGWVQRSETHRDTKGALRCRCTHSTNY